MHRPKDSRPRLLAVAAAATLSALSSLHADGDGTTPPAPAEATSAPPTAIDSLDEELALLELASTRRVKIPPGIRTMHELLQALSAQAGIAVDAEWNELVRSGVKERDPPPIQSGEGSLLAVLDACCVASASSIERPRAEAVLGRIRLVPPSSAAALRRTRSYQADALAEEFVELATRHIDPEGWTRSGGEVQDLSVVDGAVIVSAPASVHRRVAALFDELRATKPPGVQFSIDAWRVPAKSYRDRAGAARRHGGNDESSHDLLDPTSMAGAVRLLSPAMVAAIGATARSEVKSPEGTTVIELRPERDESGGVVTHYSIRLEEGDRSTTAQGVLPVPLDSPPATIAVDTADDHVLLVRLAGRPLLRGVAGHGASAGAAPAGAAPAGAPAGNAP